MGNGITVDEPAREMAREAKAEIKAHKASCGQRYRRIAEFQKRLQGDIRGQRAEQREDMQALRHEQKGDNEKLHDRISESKTAVTKAIIGSMAAIIGTLITLLGGLALLLYNSLAAG